MKWMEIVRLRSSQGVQEEIITAIADQLFEIEEGCRDVEVMLLQHALFDGDLSAVLAWDNEREPVRTREGLLLAQTLERHGAIDHAVWRAAPGFEQRMNECANRHKAAGGDQS